MPKFNYQNIPQELRNLKQWGLFELKWVEAQKNRVKTFEIRKNDRNFKVGDRLMLYEINPKIKIKPLIYVPKIF